MNTSTVCQHISFSYANISNTCIVVFLNAEKVSCGLLIIHVVNYEALIGHASDRGRGREKQFSTLC